MSSPLAIAAVTTTLRNLLARGLAPDAELADATITMQPPDRARAATATGNQLNVFLYQATPSAAWRNRDLPAQVHAGEPTQPPLALNLFYLLTAYGRDNDAQRPFSHMLLGRAMSILHDHPVLGAAEIAAAMPDSDIGTQLERVRLTPQPMPLEDLSKLWTAFQAQFRASVAYEAAVVLIESTRLRRAPLPVLRRGEADSGAQALGSAIPPFPEITAVEPPGPAEPGATLTLLGHDLGGTQVEVQLEATRLSFRSSFPATSVAEDRVTLRLPADLPAGIHGLTLHYAQGSTARPSNTVALNIAPAITAGLPVTMRAAGGALTLGLAAPIMPGQRAYLLLADQVFPAPPNANATNRLRFQLPPLPPGQHPARLRVDGVDSAVVADRSARPLHFDPRCLVTVLP